MGAGRDAETMGRESPIAVIEVMGRDAGWLAASAALAKREDRDAPHVICVPEVPVDERRFLDRIEDAYSRYGFAVAVVAENARGATGVLGGEREPWYVDEFGHPYFEGAGRYLAALVGGHLNVRNPVREARHHPAFDDGLRLKDRRAGGRDGGACGGPLCTGGRVRQDGHARQRGGRDVLLLNGACTVGRRLRAR